MIDRNEPIRVPENLNARIWRFIELWKLESLLKDRGLFFCRADQFEDPYEGLFPDDFLQGADAEHRIRMLLYYRSHAYASCWHLSEHESASMWKLYADKRGVALKSTFSRLQHAFSAHKETHGLTSVDVGLVQYDSDYLHARFNIRKAILHKRPNFETEREVRACFHQPASTSLTSKAVAGSPTRPHRYPA